MSLNTIFEQSIRSVPSGRSFTEAFGYLLAGASCLLAVALFSYDPNDLIRLARSYSSVRNLAGPFGVELSAYLLQTFGISSFALPMVAGLQSLMMILGFSALPKFRLLASGLLSLTALSTLVQIVGPSLALGSKTSMLGGAVGLRIAMPLLENFNYYGSIIIVAIATCVFFVLSGMFSLVGVANGARNKGSRMLGSIKSTVRKRVSYGEHDEEMVREALAKAALYRTIQKNKDKHLNNPASALKEVKSHIAAVTNSKKSARVSEPNNVDKISFRFTGRTPPRLSTTIFGRSFYLKGNQTDIAKKAKLLETNLLHFKIEGKIKKVNQGPVVTTYEFEPKAGTKVSKLTAIADDLALMLEAQSLRILSPIPGRKVVGIEVPNKKRSSIGIRGLLEHRSFRTRAASLPIALGLDTDGKAMIDDLSKMPHLLVAGSTGSGKSVFMNTLIASLVARHSPKDLRLIMIDPKMVELSAYNAIPHMATPVITDPSDNAKEVLNKLVEQMEERFTLMGQLGSKNIQSYNETIKSKRKADFPKFSGRWETMPFVVLIVDELADMMMVLGKDAEKPIARLAQKSRAAGIHLVIATQRPSTDVVTGIIKANFPTRIAFRVTSAVDSRTILDASGAEKLLGQGDGLLLNANGLSRFHGAYLSEQEIAKLVKNSSSIR